MSWELHLQLSNCTGILTQCPPPVQCIQYSFDVQPQLYLVGPHHMHTFHNQPHSNASLACWPPKDIGAVPVNFICQLDTHQVAFTDL